MDGIVTSIQSGLSCYPVKKEGEWGKMKHGVLALVVVVSVAGMLLPTSAHAEETYRFERLWSVLQQPWYYPVGGREHGYV